ncbi:MAG: hypothetical protein IH604_04415 [Burkholderiales bacterium]|nr:hypothetical protein [Burkholderiales bacterium]
MHMRMRTRTQSPKAARLPINRHADAGSRGGMSVPSFCKRLKVVLFAVSILFASAAQADGLLSWPQVKRKIEDHWKTTAPRERVLSVERKGKPQYSASQRVTDSAYIGSSWYSAWITSYETIQGSFARQVALVTVERPNKSKARFEVAALYRGEGKSWRFDQVAIGPVTELGAPGDPAQPAEEAALAIFREAWAGKRSDMEVKSMKLLAPPKLAGTPKRRVLRYRMEVSVLGTAKASKKYRGQSLTCRPEDYSSVLIWDTKRGAWRADESMIQIINKDRVCDIN